MEAARLEQDRKMGTVLEGIMARLGAGPLPLAEVMTPPRGGAGQYACLRPTTRSGWQTILSCLTHRQERHHSKAGRHQQQTVALLQGQTVAVPVPEAEAARGRAMEAALRGMMGTGGEAMLQLLRNSGHEGVASMLTVEGSGPSTQK